jgi:ATP-dependent RNA helicase SUPV3L1/SUV3
MFPDVELVRSVQTELDQVIQEGVGNIVQLLRNSDSGTSSGAARVGDEDAFEARNLLKNKFRSWDHKPKVQHGNHQDEETSGSKAFGGGRLTNQLIKQGLLTKDMVKELRREWVSKDDKSNNKSSDE